MVSEMRQRLNLSDVGAGNEIKSKGSFKFESKENELLVILSLLQSKRLLNQLTLRIRGQKSALYSQAGTVKPRFTNLIRSGSQFINRKARKSSQHFP